MSAKISYASSFRTLLFKPFGPDAFLVAKAFSTDSTSVGVTLVQLLC